MTTGTYGTTTLLLFNTAAWLLTLSHWNEPKSRPFRISNIYEAERQGTEGYLIPAASVGGGGGGGD